MLYGGGFESFGNFFRSNECICVDKFKKILLMLVFLIFCLLVGRDFLIRVKILWDWRWYGFSEILFLVMLVVVLFW